MLSQEKRISFRHGTPFVCYLWRRTGCYWTFFSATRRSVTTSSLSFTGKVTFRCIWAMPRSRRAANVLARERLQQERIGDEDVLDVLRLWYFKQNKTRVNVFPAGVMYVNSDTLGAASHH